MTPLDLLSHLKKTKLCFTWFLCNFFSPSSLKICDAFGITYSFKNTMKLVGPLSWKTCMGQVCSDFGGLATWPLRQTRSDKPCGVAAWPSHTPNIQARPALASQSGLPEPAEVELHDILGPFCSGQHGWSGGGINILRHFVN